MLSTIIIIIIHHAFSALMLLFGHPACKNEWWGVGMVICPE